MSGVASSFFNGPVSVKLRGKSNGGHFKVGFPLLPDPGTPERSNFMSPPQEPGVHLPLKEMTPDTRIFWWKKKGQMR